LETNKKVNLFLSFVFAFIITNTVEASSQVQQGLAIFVAIAWLWITQALPISTTALLIPVLAMISDILPATEAFSNFSSPVIFLFMGGFALAAALQKYSLDKLFAVKMLSLSSGSPLLAVLLLFLTTALLSMWKCSLVNTFVYDSCYRAQLTSSRYRGSHCFMCFVRFYVASGHPTQCDCIFIRVSATKADDACRYRT